MLQQIYKLTFHWELQYKILLLFAIVVVVVAIYFRIQRFITESRQSDTSEGFIAQPNALDELENRQAMWPVDDQTGLRPIVLRNVDSFPAISLAYSYGAGGPAVSHLGPVLDVLRGRVYPFSPLVPTKDDAEVLEYVTHSSPVAHAVIRFGLIRENVALENHKSSKLNASDDSSREGWDVLCPMYHEIMLALGHKHGFINNMQQLRDVRPDGTTFTVAVLACDLPYFQLVCRNLNVSWKPDTRRFGLRILGSGVGGVIEELQTALSDMSQGDLDMIFLLTHPKNSLIQAHVFSSPTRLVDIYPPSAIPDEASQDSPYDPTEPTADLRVKFARDMKRDIPWLFREQMDRTRIPVVAYESADGQNVEENRPESPIYQTFRVRTLLIANRPWLSISSDKSKVKVRREYLDARRDIANRLLQYYQTLEHALMEWNSDSSDPHGGPTRIKYISGVDEIRLSRYTKIQNPPKGKMIAFNSSDRDSFQFEAMGAVPKELPIAEEFKSVLFGAKLIKSETVFACKL